MPTSSADTSFLLLVLGALVAVLSAHVFMGWVRLSHHFEGLRRWGALGVAALVFGTGFSVACSIGLLSEAVAFPIGFKRLWALGLWAAGVLLAWPIAAWPSYRPGLISSFGTGTLLAALVTALLYGWAQSVGFRPGLVMRHEFIAIAWIAMSIGFGAAITLALPSADSRSRKEWWRFAGAGVMGVATLVGESVMMAGANLQTQVGSVYRGELSASLLSLIGGALLPMVLMLMSVDLELRRRQRRASRRRRRYRRGLSTRPAADGLGGAPSEQPPVARA